MQDAGAPSRGCKEKEEYKRSEIEVVFLFTRTFSLLCIVACWIAARAVRFVVAVHHFLFFDSLSLWTGSRLKGIRIRYDDGFWTLVRNFFFSFCSSLFPFDVHAHTHTPKPVAPGGGSKQLSECDSFKWWASRRARGLHRLDRR